MVVWPCRIVPNANRSSIEQLIQGRCVVGDEGPVLRLAVLVFPEQKVSGNSARMQVTVTFARCFPNILRRINSGLSLNPLVLSAQAPSKLDKHGGIQSAISQSTNEHERVRCLRRGHEAVGQLVLRELASLPGRMRIGIGSSQRFVSHPDKTPIWRYFRVGGPSSGTSSMSALAIWRQSRIIPAEKRQTTPAERFTKWCRAKRRDQRAYLPASASAAS